MLKADASIVNVIIVETRPCGSVSHLLSVVVSVFLRAAGSSLITTHPVLSLGRLLIQQEDEVQ